MATTGDPPDSEMTARAHARHAIIREATPADAAAIARVTIATWRAAYRGIVPDRVLDGFSQGAMTARFAAGLARATARGTFYLVADDPALGVVGFLGGGPESTDEPTATGEIMQLYVLPAQQRHGLGRRLLGAGAQQLAQRGYHALVIWVFTANEAARRFYEALGGEYLREREIEIFGARMPETGYGWRDTRVLLGGIAGGGGPTGTG